MFLKSPESFLVRSVEKSVETVPPLLFFIFRVIFVPEVKK